MSSAIFRALADDSELNELGIDENAIFPDYSMEVAPRKGVFLIPRWGNQDVTRGIRLGPDILTVWAHVPQEITTDYGVLNNVLDRVKWVLTGLEHVDGEDGWSVTSVLYTGRGGNLYDPGFKTITKNSAFRVLLRSGIIGA